MKRRIIRKRTRGGEYGDNENIERRRISREEVDGKMKKSGEYQENKWRIIWRGGQEKENIF